MRTTERTRFAWVLMIVMAMILAACGESSSDETDAGDDQPTATTAAPADDTPSEDTTEETTAATEAPSGEPIVIGSTLALTGFLSPTAAIHKVAGEPEAV